MRNASLLVLALVLAGSWSVARLAAEETKGTGYPEIALNDLKDAIRDGKVTLLDCNGSESYAKFHIPGALDFQASREKLSEKLPSDKGALVVSYCGNEHCPAYKAGASAAEKLGYTNVKHFAPGIKGWVNAGEKTEVGATKAYDGPACGCGN